MQQHQRGEQSQHDTAAGVTDDHRQPPVKPVGDRAAWQAEDELHDQLRGADQARDSRRVRQRQDQQRVGDWGGFGSGVGENLADPQQPETPVAHQRHGWRWPGGSGRLRRPAHARAASAGPAPVASP
jgi:hypothetical protein